MEPSAPALPCLQCYRMCIWNGPSWTGGARDTLDIETLDDLSFLFQRGGGLYGGKMKTYGLLYMIRCCFTGQRWRKAGKGVRMFTMQTSWS
jgi:hypothetical protein